MIKIKFIDGSERIIEKYNLVSYGREGIFQRDRILIIDSRLRNEGKFIIPFEQIKEVQII